MTRLEVAFMKELMSAFPSMLGVELPASYQNILETYGADLASDPVHDEGLIKGLGSADFAIGTTLSFRDRFQDLPHHYVLIGYAGTRLIEKMNEPVDVYLMLDSRDGSVHSIDVLGKRRQIAESFDRWIAPLLDKARLRARFGRRLLVIVFEDVDQAERLRAELKDLEAKRAVHLKDTFVAVKDETGTLSLKDLSGSSRKSFLSGGAAGLVFRGAMKVPLLGAALGGIARTLSDVSLDLKLDHDFVRNASARLLPATSAVFILLSEWKPREILNALKGFGGKVMLTTLGEEQERRVQAALDAEPETME